MEFHGPRTQILTEANIANGNITVYTVPAGKKFYLIEASLHVTTGTPASGLGNGSIHNDLDVHQRDIVHIEVGANPQTVLADHFNPGWPVELLAGWTIQADSSAAAVVVDCDIFGLEVDA